MLQASSAAAAAAPAAVAAGEVLLAMALPLH
jgi:hypothetical protein